MSAGVERVVFLVVYILNVERLTACDSKVIVCGVCLFHCVVGEQSVLAKARLATRVVGFSGAPHTALRASSCGTTNSYLPRIGQCYVPNKQFVVEVEHSLRIRQATARPRMSVTGSVLKLRSRRSPRP